MAGTKKSRIEKSVSTISADNVLVDYQELVKNTFIATVITNSQGRIIFFNQAAENLWGQKSQDIMNRSVEALFLNESSDKKQLTNLPFRDNLGFPGNYELKGLKGDGSVIELQISVSATGKGADTQIAFFAVDNTEKKNYKDDIVKSVSALKGQEDALRKNQGVLDAINKSLGYIEFEPDGTVIKANDLFLSVTGYTLDEIRGKHHRIFVDPVYAASPQYLDFWSDLRRGRHQEGEFCRIARDGNIFWIQATYSPVKDENDRVVKVVKIASDITAQKNQNLDFKGQIEAIGKSSAIIEFNMDGTIRHANENFLKITGYTLNEIKNQHHRIFCEFNYLNSHDYKLFWDKLNRGEFESGTFKRIGKNGKEIYIQASYNPILDFRGKPFKVVKFASDVTSQKEVLFKIQDLVDVAGKEGNLRKRLDTRGIDPNLEEFVEAVNNLMENVSAPVLEVSRIITLISQGDLTQRYRLDSKGDIKDMTDSLNLAADNLNMLLGNISQISSLVAASSEELLVKGEQMKNTTQEVASATQQMAEGAQQQAQQTDESSKLIDMVLKASNDMGKKGEIIARSAEKVLSSASEGLLTIKRVVDNMGEIQDAAKKTSGSINILTQRSEEIARTLNIITDIASQTNLLALNAAIEAARAGEAGRGFAVVAEEIRKLAEDSRKSAVDIEKVIREVQKDISAAGKSIEMMEISVKNGNQASRESEVVFSGIQSSSTENYDLSKAIIDATVNQKDAILNTVKNIEKIVVVSEETASGTEEIATSARDLSQGMNEVTTTSRDLADVASQLQSSIQKFRLSN